MPPETWEHPARRALTDELHARPFMVIEAPAQVLHLTLVPDAEDGGMEVIGVPLLRRFCALSGQPFPQIEGSHFSASFADFELKWEQHAEFVTYTLYAPADPDEEPFRRSPATALPEAWWEGLRGRVLMAAQVAFRRGSPEGDDWRERLFDGASPAGAKVLGGGAEVWSDFRISPQGFTRFLVCDLGLREKQAGRLVQRILEIETYRMTAFLALPIARRIAPELAALDDQLLSLTVRMAAGREQDQALLEELSGLSARAESLSASAAYRFSAAAAYQAVIDRRILELRESRIEGFPTFGEFLDRRFAPAMASCRSTAQQQERLAERVVRTTQLLRSRVDISMERQNAKLLESMNRKSTMQLRLQEAVESLSVAAVSYYVVGLLMYALKPWIEKGGPLVHDFAGGVIVAVILGVVAAAARAMRRRIAEHGDQGVLH